MAKNLKQNTNTMTTMIAQIGQQSHLNSDIQGEQMQTDSVLQQVENQEQVQNTVAQHVNQIMGETTKTQGDLNKYTTIAIPLDHRVTDKTKAKIWADQMIDLENLFEPDQPTEYSIRFKPGSINELQLAPEKQTSKPITTIAHWCGAFNIFLTVYSRKYPERIPDMLTYQSHVKQLAARGGDWVKYDRVFRELRQSENIPWNKKVIDLWVDCRDAPPRINTYNKQFGNNKFRNNQPFRGGQYGGQYGGQSNAGIKPRGNHPKGYCYAYHDQGRCTKQNCNFNHKCYTINCGGTHPIFKCNKSSQGQQRQQTNTYSNQGQHNVSSNQSAGSTSQSVKNTTTNTTK
jgi:hypothetical protein